MLNNFFKHYTADEGFENPGEYTGSLPLNDGLRSLLREIGGRSWNKGLYRTCSFAQVDEFSEIGIKFAEGAQTGDLQVFGYDWGGRLFGLNMNDVIEGLPQVVMIDTGSAEIYEIGTDIYDFHESVLNVKQDAALASNFFSQWLKKHPEPVDRHSCIGYTSPLFLGGTDNLANLSRQDLSVYLELMAQIWGQLD